MDYLCSKPEGCVLGVCQFLFSLSINPCLKLCFAVTGTTSKSASHLLSQVKIDWFYHVMEDQSHMTITPNLSESEQNICALCGNLNTACEKCVRQHYTNQFNRIQPDDLLLFTITRESLAYEYDTKNDSIRMSKHVIRKGLSSTGSKVQIGFPHGSVKSDSPTAVATLSGN